MAWPKLSERPEHFVLNPAAHPLKCGLVFAGLGRTHGTNRYHDSSQRENHGTLTNMEPATDWVFNNTINRFMTLHDGSNEYCQVPLVNTFADIPQTPACTLCAWIRPSNFTRNEVICSVTSGNSSYNHYRLRFRGDVDGDPISAFSEGNSAPCNVNSTSGAGGSDGVFHAAAIFNGGNYRAAYFNGGNGAIATDSAGISGTYPSLYGRIGYHDGRSRDSDTYFTGYIADVLIYARALSPAEIQQLADPSNVMLSGLILPPRRKLWEVSGGAPPAENYLLTMRAANKRAGKMGGVLIGKQS